MYSNDNSDLKAIIYCRVSDKKQVEEGSGLDSQETRCREFAKNRGYDVVDTYHEGGVTGKLLDRPQIQAMLRFLKSQKGKKDYVVIIDDISRLARDIETHIQLRAAIQATGAKLESPSVHFGEDSDSRLVEHMLASVAAHHREKNAETTRNRMRAGIGLPILPWVITTRKLKGGAKCCFQKSLWPPSSKKPYRALLMDALNLRPKCSVFYNLMRRTLKTKKGGCICSVSLTFYAVNSMQGVLVRLSISSIISKGSTNP
ncbi:hypothetical protein AB835_10905 [Candidatus Endobugula sertula]|uniref:Resolvase/invertase-type recombinase catalytic domain-containing protein n=1 Tax=Candidatus Endobugula sertula TaxID=62101 RepID=A0A1D2QNC0_9GAMM|nr:hypothetical protein AB835_10905 [Candidatus Endobugula sertula]